ncbi:protein unc-45 homolog B-like [Argonauta hians]
MPQITEITEATALKEKGNTLFKNNQYEEAISVYTDALDQKDVPVEEKIACLKNRSACYLKTKQYLFAVADATEALKENPHDTKALYRRCQGYQEMGQIEDAYKDATQLLKIDPKNQAVQKIMQQLVTPMQEKVKEQTSMDGKVAQMFNLAFQDNPDVTRDTKLTATNNIIVLAREESGAEKIVRENGIFFLHKMAQTKDDFEIQQAAYRALCNLADNSRKRTERIIKEISLPVICETLNTSNDKLSMAASQLVCTIINGITDVDAFKARVKEINAMKRRGERVKPAKFSIDEAAQTFVNEIFTIMTKMLPSRKVCGLGRDTIMEILIKYITDMDGVGWVKTFIESEGLYNLLTIAGIHCNVEAVIKVTEHSRMHSALLLSKIYDDMIGDKQRDHFKERCHEYFKDSFGDGDIDSTVEAIRAITTLLQGPYDVGSMLIGMEGVLGILMSMCKSDNKLHKMVAVEALVFSASKKDKCTGILKDAIPVLDSLYESSDPEIRVRALVGLCKMASFKGTDYSIKTLEDGENILLAEDCLKFLEKSEDKDLWKWATEGFAYLSLDADIKELLIKNAPALHSLIEVAKHAKDKITSYAAITVFVNLTNSYDKQDVPEGIKELAKFAKHHVPEEHPKDSLEYTKKRTRKLAEEGMVTALVELSKTESENSREQICRIFIALVYEADLRGLVVQGGGAKALLSLFMENTEVGKECAAHSLAKIGVTMDPNIAFPGQRMYEVVRPIIYLLDIKHTGIQNFEALMALTNLASVGESVRKRILSENGFPQIEHYLYEDHDMIRRAATECVCNMVMSDDVKKLFEGENDRVKLMLLFSSNEDEPTALGAAGALAILSSSAVVCKKVIEVKNWIDHLLALAVNENIQLQHRGIYVITNMIKVEKDIAANIIESQLLEVLMAVSKFDDPAKGMIRECAEAALQKAAEYELIKPTQVNSEGS